MAVGRPVTKQSLDADAANAATAFRNALLQVRVIADWLGTKNVSDLKLLTDTSGGTYTDDEAFLLKLAFEKMDVYRKAFEGGPATPGNDNLAAFIVPLVGLTGPG